MARRKGLLGRLADRLKEAVGLKPRRRYRPPPEPGEIPGGPPKPPPPAPPVPPGGAPPTGDAHERRMAAIYARVYRDGYGRLSQSGYENWRELFDEFSFLFDSDAEIEQYWDEFLRAYFLTTSERGHVSRDQFHSDTGIPRGEIDWEMWRTLRRGTP